MSKIMDKIIKSSIITSIVLAALGALLFFESEYTIISISYIIGGILVAIGILALINYLTKKEDKNELNVIYGVVTVIMGIVVISNPKAIGSIIPFIVGIVVVINSVLKLKYSLELKQKNNNKWKTTMILSLITVIVGMLLIINPFKGAEIITKIVGILIFTYSIIDLVTTLTIKSTINDIHNVIDNKISEADVVEEKNAEKKEATETKEKEGEEK